MLQLEVSETWDIGASKVAASDSPKQAIGSHRYEV